MVNINLATSPVQEKEGIKLGGGLVGSLAVLAILVAAYFGMVFYKSGLDSSLATAKEDYNSTLNQLKTGEAKNVLDFQNRINESEKLLKEDVDSKGLLEILERTMIPGVYLSSYNFVGDSKLLELECMTTNFNSVAQQILSFKNSNLFASVEGGETSFSEQDKAIRFKIILTQKTIESNLK